MYISSSIIILSSTLSLLSPVEQNNDSYFKTVLSPTLNQPIENLSDTQTKKLMEQIFIDTIKQELHDKN